jgi:hypothetical protein
LHIDKTKKGINRQLQMRERVRTDNARTLLNKVKERRQRVTGVEPQKPLDLEQIKKNYAKNLPPPPKEPEEDQKPPDEHTQPVQDPKYNNKLKLKEIPKQTEEPLKQQLKEDPRKNHQQVDPQKQQPKEEPQKQQPQKQQPQKHQPKEEPRKKHLEDDYQPQKKLVSKQPNKEINEQKSDSKWDEKPNQKSFKEQHNEQQKPTVKQSKDPFFQGAPEQTNNSLPPITKPVKPVKMIQPNAIPQSEEKKQPIPEEKQPRPQLKNQVNKVKPTVHYKDESQPLSPPPPKLKAREQQHHVMPRIVKKPKIMKEEEDEEDEEDYEAEYSRFVRQRNKNLPPSWIVDKQMYIMLELQRLQFPHLDERHDANQYAHTGRISSEMPEPKQSERELARLKRVPGAGAPPAFLF